MEEKETSPQRGYNLIQASHLLKNSSVPAVSQLGHSNSKHRQIFWVIVLIICVLGCIYEMYLWLNVYFSYPVVINMEIENPLKMEFPAVTVCNLNRVKSEFEACIKEGRVCKLPIQTRTLILSETWDVVLSKPESKSQRKLQEEKILFMQNYSELDKILRRVYGYSYFQMIKRCSFDGVFCDYYNFTLFQDKQYGNCYTFNSRKTKSTLISHRAGPDFGLEIEIDPLENTYLDITPNVGLLVVIHNKDEYPNIAAEGINISPGYETHVAITKTSIKRLPAPYRDKCFNYNRSATDAFIRSELDCIQMCMQDASFASCSCVDPSLPALKYMEKCNLKNTTAMTCLKTVLEKMHDRGLPCNCPLPCLTRSYEVQFSSSLWRPFSANTPFTSVHKKDTFNNNSANHSYECHTDTEYISSICDIQSNKVLTGNSIKPDKRSKQSKQGRKSLLKVFFKNFEHKIYTQEPAFTEAELYAHVGGHLNFWLGLSIIAVFECVQNIVFFLKALKMKAAEKM